MDNCELKNRLLSGKDQLAEEFVLGLVGEIVTDRGSNVSGADDSHQKTLSSAVQKLTELSPILAHRFLPILKEYLSHVQQLELDQVFASVDALPTSLDDMSLKYKNCFNAFVDADDCVSFKALDTKLLGNLTPKDVYVLTLWAMATCKRQKGDNLLQLICSGKSSCGNSYYLFVAKINFYVTV